MDKILFGKKTAFLTLGCKVNSYETEAMQQLFVQAGALLVDFTEKADIYVVNTCTVTNIADRKSRQMLHKAKKYNPDAIIIAAGCYVQAASEQLLEDNAVDLLIGNNQKNEIVEILNNYLADKHENQIMDISQESKYEALEIETVAEKTRAFIKIQDGCNQFCSYCIIPYARGRIRSRKKEDILIEVKKLAESGYKEVVLTGIHLSSYGFENKAVSEQISLQVQDGKIPLLDLIIDVSKIRGIERIRLGSLEPRIITEEFVNTLSESNKFCPHFHLSLQSGCDATLKRMNRKYTTKQYKEKCLLIRKYFEHPAITTDIITGFPMESDLEYMQTREFIKEIKFSQIHLFKYSKRKGTQAEKMEGQVPEPVKSIRSEELAAIEEELRKEYRNYFFERQQKVLGEEYIVIKGNSYMIGHNERYVKIAVQTERDRTNEFYTAKIIDYFEKDMLLGQILD